MWLILCKAWDDHARECTILSAIDTARRYSIKDNMILADIMTQFGLTKKEAKAYMAKKSAQCKHDLIQQYKKAQLQWKLFKGLRFKTKNGNLPFQNKNIDTEILEQNQQ